MFVSGGKTLGAANAVAQLVPPGGAADNRVTNVTISASGAVAVGSPSVVASPTASVVGTLIPAGSAQSFSVTDLADVYVCGAAGGERVSWSAKAL
jgi:hypothetical protein